MLAALSVTPPNRYARPGGADLPIAVEEVHNPEITTGGSDNLGAQFDEVTRFELLAIARRGDFQPRRHRVIVVNDHRDRGMFEVDVVRVNPWRRRNQMEEHRLVPFVKIVVD